MLIHKNIVMETVAPDDVTGRNAFPQWARVTSEWMLEKNHDSFMQYLYFDGIAYDYFTDKWKVCAIDVDHKDLRDRSFKKYSDAKKYHADILSGKVTIEHEKKRYPGAFRTSSNTWRASMYVRGERINLGTYKTQEEAYEAYKNKMMELIESGDKLPKGVLKVKNRFVARTRKDGKNKYIGSYMTKEEAAMAYVQYRTLHDERL